MILENDLVTIRYSDRVYIKRVKKGESLNVKSHILKYDDIIGKEEGIFLNGFFCSKTHA
jgi:hypothetical protein